MINLEVNEFITIQIQAREYWNSTNILLNSKLIYLFEVNGQQIWCDSLIKSTANGYKMWWLNWVKPLRRQPNQAWFALIGNINRRGNTDFLIGEKVQYQPFINGELFCYANDVPFIYWNNHGSLQLTITRTD